MMWPTKKQQLEALAMQAYTAAQQAESLYELRQYSTDELRAAIGAWDHAAYRARLVVSSFGRDKDLTVKWEQRQLAWSKNAERLRALLYYEE